VSFGANGPVLGISEVNQQHAFNVYPNPARDFIMIEATAAKHATIRLFNMQGVLVQSAEANGRYRMQTDALPAGMYLLKCSNGEDQQTFKLVIQK
jgi:hypothetical protein